MAARHDTVDDNEQRAVKGLVLTGEVVSDKQIYVLYCTALPELSHQRLHGHKVITGQKAIDILSKRHFSFLI